MDGASTIISNYTSDFGLEALPKDRDAPFFQVKSIFEPEHLASLQEALRTIPGEPKQGGNRDYLITVSLLHVTYDSEGNVENIEAPFSKERYHGLELEGPSEELREIVQKTIHVVLQRYGKELELTGMHKIWMDCGRYIIPKDQVIDPLNWHKDPMTTWTMVNLIDDPLDSNSGWEGGDILFAPTQLASEENRNDDMEHMGEEPIYEKAFQISHACNAAIFFHNHKTMHTVTPLKGRSSIDIEPVKEKKKSLLSRLLSRQKVKEKTTLEQFSIRNIWTVFLWDDVKIPGSKS
ncbi:MAG: hypothetical protein Q8K75_07655 [Chlamydiales bacterium]|nr:hypothetical protein [Chlamydiales bacterium]